jgi:hypothetical protein
MAALIEISLAARVGQGLVCRQGHFCDHGLQPGLMAGKLWRGQPGVQGRGLAGC